MPSMPPRIRLLPVDRQTGLFDPFSVIRSIRLKPDLILLCRNNRGSSCSGTLVSVQKHSRADHSYQFPERSHHRNRLTEMRGELFVNLPRAPITGMPHLETLPKFAPLLAPDGQHCVVATAYSRTFPSS